MSSVVGRSVSFSPAVHLDRLGHDEKPVSSPSRMLYFMENYTSFTNTKRFYNCSLCIISAIEERHGQELQYFLREN